METTIKKGETHYKCETADDFIAACNDIISKGQYGYIHGYMFDGFTAVYMVKFFSKCKGNAIDSFRAIWAKNYAVNPKSAVVRQVDLMWKYMAPKS